MLKIRRKIIEWLFEVTQKQYTRFKKKTPWNISNTALLGMPANTFGYRLGRFLEGNGFELIPKVERHDAYHVVTGFGIMAEDEVALQYLCFGNGKRTPYLFAVLCIGTIVLPEFWSYYRRSFHFGKRSNSFHHFDFKTVLPLDYYRFRSMIFSEETIQAMISLQKNKTDQNFKTAIYGKRI